MFERARQALIERIQRKKRAYRDLFLIQGKLSPAGSIVLADLKRVCQFTRGGLRVSPVTRMTDPYATAYQNGQRDMYIRILMMTGLDGGQVTEEMPDARSDTAESH